MSKTINVEINDEDLNKLKEIYTKDKSKISKNIKSFDEFLDWTVQTAIKTHIQFATMNDKMSSLLNLNTDSLGSDFDMSNVSKFINELMNDKTKTPTTKKETVDPNKKKN